MTGHLPKGFRSGSYGTKSKQEGAQRRTSDAECEIGSRILPVFRPKSAVPGIRRINPSCVDEVAPFKRGKCLDGFSYLLLGEPQVVEAL